MVLVPAAALAKTMQKRLEKIKNAPCLWVRFPGEALRWKTACGESIVARGVFGGRHAILPPLQKGRDVR